MVENIPKASDIIRNYDIVNTILKDRNKKHKSSFNIDDSKRDDLLKDFIYGYMYEMKNHEDIDDLIRLLVKLDKKFKTPYDKTLKDEVDKHVFKYFEIKPHLSRFKKEADELKEKELKTQKLEEEKILKKKKLEDFKKEQLLQLAKKNLTPEELEIEELVEQKLILYGKDARVERTIKKAEAANYIIKFFNIINVKGNLYIKQGGIYIPDGLSNNTFIKSKIYELLEKLDLTDKNNYVKIVEDVTSAIEMKNPLVHPPFNKELCVINVKNGLLKIDFNKKQTELIPHSNKDDYKFTYQLPIEYNPDVSIDFAEKFLSQYNTKDVDNDILLGQIGAQIILQRCFPDINFKQLLHTIHAGTNAGKTSFLQHVYKVFGTENMSNVSLDQMADRFQTSAMYGKIANIHDDLPNKSIPNDRIKNITGGALTPIEFKNKTPFAAKLNMTHVYTVNRVPRLINVDEALYKRFIYIHLERKFDDNPNFEREISLEQSQSMFNSFIKIAFDIYDNGNHLHGGSTWKELRKQSYTDNNLMYKFIRDYFIKTDSEDDIVTRRLFNAEFVRVCEEEYFCSPDDIPSKIKVMEYMTQNNFIHHSEHSGAEKKEDIGGKFERCYYKLKWKDDSKNISRKVSPKQKLFVKRDERQEAMLFDEIEEEPQIIVETVKETEIIPLLAVNEGVIDEIERDKRDKISYQNDLKEYEKLSKLPNTEELCKKIMKRIKNYEKTGIFVIKEEKL